MVWVILESGVLAKGNPETGEIVLDNGDFCVPYEGVDYRLPQNKVCGKGEKEWETSVLESVILAKGNPETGEIVLDNGDFCVPYEGVDYRLPQNKIFKSF